jgi:hypothetical protein
MSATLMERLNFYGEMLKGNIFSRSALAVAYFLLYRHLNKHTGRCDPSISTLAAETGLTKRSVNSAVDELRKSGWWRIAQEGATIRGGRTNSYAPQFGAAKRESDEAYDTSSSGEVVKRTTPVRAESGEAQRTKVVKLPSPKPVKNQESVDPHRPATHSARVRMRDPGEDGANSEFETFWRIYPHRGEHPDPKKPARLKFEAAVKRGVDPAAIIAGAERFRAHVEQQGTEPKFRPQAKTWLNEERWAQLHEPERPRLRAGMN